MTSKIFPKSPIVLLDGAGAVQPLHLRAPLFRSGFVVLARERCLFERLDTAQGLNARSAVAAARIHAQTGAPYQRSGTLITRHGPSFGIWWWDAQWVADRLAEAGLDPASKIVPEPMARAAAEGWRIAKASSGYEAQLWRGGFLVADLWRRRPFDQEAWQDFVRVQPDQAGAEGAVLMAQEAPYTLQSAYRRTQLSDWTPERKGQAAALAAAVILACVGAYFVGQSIGLDRSTETLQVETAAVKATTPGGQANVQGAVRSLIALKSAVEYPDPAVLLENAQRLLEPFGHKLVAFNADRDKMRIVLPEAAVNDVTVIAAELEASPYFSDVRPSLDRNKHRLLIDMTPAGARPKTRTGAGAGASASLAAQDPLVASR